MVATIFEDVRWLIPLKTCTVVNISIKRTHYLVKSTGAPFEYSWRGSSDREVSMFFKLLIEAICVVLGRLRWPRWQDIFRYMHIYLRALSFLAVIWYCLVLQQNTTKQGHGTWRSWKMEILSTEEVQKSKIANQMSKSPPLESKLFKLRNAQQTLEWVLCIRDLQLRKQRMTTRNPQQHPSTPHPHQDYKSLSILVLEDWCWCFFFL